MPPSRSTQSTRGEHRRALRPYRPPTRRRTSATAWSSGAPASSGRSARPPRGRPRSIPLTHAASR
eukprot:11332949-Alexandrium_andersonii.AAC.1